MQLLLVLVAALAFAPSAGAAARVSPKLVRIAAPLSGWPVAARTTVVVRAAPGTRVVVRIGTRDISHRFKRRGRSLRGYLVPHDIRRLGPEALRVRARRGKTRGFATIAVHRTRRVRSLLRVSLRRTSKTATTFDLKTHTHLRKAYLRAFLNGHRLEQLFTAGRPGRHRLRLSAAHGLRFGRNTLRVVARDRRGHADFEVRHFRVRRTRPLAAQVYQPLTIARRPAFLDAAPSRSAHGGRLSYRWRLLDRPRRSHARLGSRTGRKLRFVPDRRGRYRVRLTVRELRGRASAAGAAAPRVATSDVTIGAQSPTTATTGTPLSTSTTNPDSAITYGHVSIPAAAGAGAIQYLLIDRTTGGTSAGTIPAQSFSPGCSDLGALIQFVQSLSSGDMLVLTRQQSPAFGSCFAGLSQTQIQQLQAVLGNTLDTLGVGDSSFEDTVLGTGAFSLVGVPGMGDDEGVGNADQDSSQASISGFVLPSYATTYQGTTPVEGPAQLRFQQFGSASFAASPSGGSITGVGGAASTQLPAVPAGSADLEVFDAHSLKLIDSQTTATLATVQAFLNQYDDPSPPRVWVVRFNGLYTLNNHDDSNQLQQLRAAVPNGPPNPTPMLNQIVDDLVAIGGNRAFITNTLGGLNPQPYTLVGLTGGDAVEGTPMKTSGNTAVSSASVSGFFSPDGAQRFDPGSGGAGFNTDLQQLVGQPPTPYAYPTSPADSGGQYAAAEAQIFNFLVAQNDVCPLSDANQTNSGCTTFFPTGIRVNYASASFRFVLPEITTSLACQDEVGGTPGAMPKGLWPGGSPGYSLEQLEALRRMVCDEMVAITTVETNMFTPLRTAITQGEAAAAQDVTAQGSLLEGLIQQSPRPSPLKDPDDAIGKAAAALSATAGIASSIASAVSVSAPTVAVIVGTYGGIASAVSGVLSFVETFKHGSTSTVDAELGTADITTANLIATVQSEYADTTNRISDIEQVIFTDPAKLGIPQPTGSFPLTAYARAKPAGGEFNYGAETDSVAASMRIATNQLIGPQLVNAQPQNSECGKTSFAPYPDGPGPMKLSAPVQFGAMEFTAHRSGGPTSTDDAPGLNYTGSTGDQTYYPYYLPFYANFASLKLGSTQLQTLDNEFFALPFSLTQTPNYADPTNALPGLGLVREDFFLGPDSSNRSCAPYASVTYTKSSKTAVPPGYTGQIGFPPPPPAPGHTPPDGLPPAN